MKLSLVNATYKNFQYLPHLISNLNEQNLLDFELIVCDQNETNELEKILNSVDVSFGIQYKKVKQIGLSIARNIGLDLAMGDIIGFVDDDCHYPKDFTEKIIDIFSQTTEIDMISVSVRDRETKALLDFTPMKKQCKITKANIFKAITSVGLFHRRIKGVRFDEQFGLGASFGSCEEMDYAYQLLEKQFDGLYLPELHVFHPPNVPIGNQSLSNILSRSKGHGAYFRKNRTPFTYTVQILLIRPLGGLLLCLLKLKVQGSIRYLYMLIGRIAGFILYRD